MNKLNNSVLLDVFSTGNEVQLYTYLLERFKHVDAMRHRYGAGIVIEITGGTAIFCSHLDTIHQNNKVRDIRIYNDELFCVGGECGGDDRCGVAVMIQMIELSIPGLYVFTFNEERGMVGMDNIIDLLLPSYDTYNYTAVICIDRMNDNNIILHNADVKMIRVHDCYPYFPAHGSVTDGFNLADELQLPAINLSCGYYAPHTVNDYVILPELENLLNTCVNYMDWIADITYIIPYNISKDYYIDDLGRHDTADDLDKYDVNWDELRKSTRIF